MIPLLEVTFQGHRTTKLQYLGEIKISLPQSYSFSIVTAKK
ncbi:hypothetical protein MNB_SV-6-862 [hydrothermal vent metagenome]|uniref:Uncharacterized protein n=1 Tax=hydrothermal vent metagenome TaxID=652676 RepID=A0A1W1BJ52_9ZZZZ